MSPGLLADALVVVHLAFVVFVAAGGLLVWRWPRLAWVHVPAFLWGAVVELAGWVCPLTPLEHQLRRAAGEVPSSVGFVETWLTPVLYPAGLGRGDQVALGVGVLLLNAGLYAAGWWRRARREASG